MTDQQQADFVNQVLSVLYKDRDFIPMVNYWVIQGGTTALLNDDGGPKPVANVLKNYYEPTVLRGQVTDAFGQGLSGVEITNGSYQALTDTQGNFDFLVPAQNVKLIFQKEGYESISVTISALQKTTYQVNAQLQSRSSGLKYVLKYLTYKLSK
jgi:uncharacterized protein YegP (UPF0339 family)